MSSLDVRVPPAAGWLARRFQELLDPLEVRRTRALYPAAPPRRLRSRAGAPGIEDFAQGGCEAAHELGSALGAADRSIEQFSSVLDFGCGAARVLPHVASLAERAECTGCDVDPEAIEWARSSHPQLRWATSHFLPPLPFSDASFDLVYSISVFSHLDELLQDQWLEEIARVLRPGGVGLLSVHGRHAFEHFRTGRVNTRWCPKDAFQRPPLSAGEFVFVPYTRSIWNRAELPGVQDGYGLAFHGEQYVRARGAPAIEVVDVLERAITAWQDLVVCRKGS